MGIQETKELSDLADKLRDKCVTSDGTLSPDLDVLYDIEAHLRGSPTMLKATTEVYINMAKRRL